MSSYRDSTSVYELDTPRKGGPPPPPPPFYKKPTLGQGCAGKRTWVNVRLALRIFILIYSLFIGTAMLLVIITWRKSKDGNEKFWPKDPQMLPTYYLLATAVVSIPIHIALIFTPCYSRQRYLTELYTKRDRIAIVIQILLAITWLVGSILAQVYRKKEYTDNSDLWTWSCAEPSQRNIANGEWVGVEGWMWKWTTVCGLLRAGYIIAYVNAFVEHSSVMTYWLNNYYARRQGYKPAPMNDA